MTIDTCNFNGKKVIVRVDFNVPLDENGKITDDTRIRGALPTLKKVLAEGGSLIIMSHMGKPKGKVNAKFSLSQSVDAVSEKLGVPVAFAADCAKASDAAAALKPGEVLLLENLRFYPEEEGKPVGIEKTDPAYEDAKKEMKSRQKDFAKTLASYADIYINDAFGTAHRKHASTAVIADSFDADHIAGGNKAHIRRFVGISFGIDPKYTVDFFQSDDPVDDQPFAVRKDDDLTFLQKLVIIAFINDRISFVNGTGHTLRGDHQQAVTELAGDQHDECRHK